MEIAPPTSTPEVEPSGSGSFRALLIDAARFWEPRRLLYNFILFLVTVTWIMATWPHFRPGLTLTSLLLMSILALIANACYSAAYFVDIPLQSTATGASRNRFRWGLWILGMVFAFVLANYWISDEIYPDFH